MSRQVSLSELQGRLSDRFIMTLASSPDNQPVVKMFLFAQHVSVCRHVRLMNSVYSTQSSSSGVYFRLFLHGGSDDRWTALHEDHCKDRQH